MTATIIPVILSGGAGSRLWPVSTPRIPKPFMAMPDGETLLEKTIRRASALAPDGPVITVTGRGYHEMTVREYRRVGVADEQRLQFILEPAARNTAPAIAMAMAHVRQRYGPDAVAVVMPSDHLIGDQAAFELAVANAVELASQNSLVTFGVVPTHAETGYGYIQAGATIGAGRQVLRFVEKPDLPTAERYLASGQYLWNSGMFCFTAGGFFAELATVDPAFVRAVESCHGASPAGDPTILDAATFSALPATSVDYALMEKAGNVAVVPADIGWNDVGSWDAIAALAPADALGNAFQGEVLSGGGKNCYVQAGSRTVALVGVEDLVVIETGDTTLIARKTRTQEVRAVVEQLRMNNQGKSSDA